MTPLPGELWIADIPFTTGMAAKRRPVLVLWLEGQDAVVAAVTSAAPRSQTDVPLVEWMSAGLRLASTVRLARLDCMEQTLLLRKQGMLHGVDADRIHVVRSQFVRPQF